MSPASERLPRRLQVGLTALLLLGAYACSSEEPAETTSTSGEAELDSGDLPDEIEIADPQKPVDRLEFVEDATEEAADRLLTFSDKLRRRDFTAASAFLSAGFAGEGLSPLTLQGTNDLPLGAKEDVFDPSSRTVQNRTDFVAGLRETTADWMHVESVIWKVKGAEFETARDSWGKLKLFIHLTGQREDLGWASIVAWGYARCVKEGGLWVLDRFDLDSYKETYREGSIFTDVSTSAGVAHTGIRFGQPGNTSYAFNGAAGGDVDGDGLWDVFVPSDERNFLYMGQPDGGFRDEAEARGLVGPDAGTGAVLFDLDNDGDQDLMVGRVGWREEGGEAAGDRLLLYLNDGKGHFEERGADFGLDEVRLAAYTLTVLDHDGDGWLDVFVCGYGRVEADHNNSWIEATNGAPNGLLRNDGGKAFTDVAPELGMTGSSWSYAAAAADYDADGDPDLYVANDYGTNRLWENRGGGQFVDVAAERGVGDIGNGMGVAWGDLSGDGKLDLYVSNMSSTAGNRILARLGEELDPEIHAMLLKLAAGNSIFFQKAEGGFERLPKEAGGINASWAWSPALIDMDLDGRLDVYCANGFVTGDQPFDT